MSSELFLDCLGSLRVFEALMASSMMFTKKRYREMIQGLGSRPLACCTI